MRRRWRARQTPVGAIPGHETVERREHECRRYVWVDRGERAVLDPGPDDAAEARLVLVTAALDDRPALDGEGPPLVDEDARPLDVVGDDRHVGPHERRQGLGRCHRPVRLGADSVGRCLETRRRSIDDRPEHVLLRRDVRIQAGPLDVEGARDVAHARAGIATLAEERARDLFDLATTCRLDHAERPPT